MIAQKKLKTLTNYFSQLGYSVEKQGKNVYYLPFNTLLVYEKNDDIHVKTSRYVFTFRSSATKILFKMLEFDLIHVRKKTNLDPYYFRERRKYKLRSHEPFYLIDSNELTVTLMYKMKPKTYTQQSFYRLFTQNPKYKIHNTLNSKS